MFLLVNTEHTNLLSKVIKGLENAEQNICLKTKDNEQFYVNQVLLSIVSPYLGSILAEGVSPGSESPVLVVPLEMRILRMLFHIKLRGLVNISHQEDVDRIIEAFHILGEKIGADQLVTDNGISFKENWVDTKVKVEDPMIVNVEDPWNVNIEDKININMEDCVIDFVDVNNKIEESGIEVKEISNKKLDKQIKTKKKAALKVKDKCSGCRYYSRRGP